MYTNIWYVAAASDAVRNRPVGVKMLGRDFVLFRDDDGKVVCLSSVCPHRGASLARGKCDSDGTLACPFHGWRFASDGRCTMVPSQADPTGAIPPSAKGDAYPVQEKYGLIWAFLGDDLANAAPIFAMPEYDDPAFRGVIHFDVWNANQHWSKMTDLDHVHLPIVHGIEYGGENPVRPPDHQVEFTDNGFRTMVVSRPQMQDSSWRLREEQTEVSSRLEFFVPGFTLRGQVAIGGRGSGWYNIFYEMSTPIDEETTQMYYLIFRSFMLEPEHDKEHLKRNLRNISQDKANAEANLPKRAPDVREWPPIRVDREDRLMQAYWQTLQQLRARGWQIDRLQMDALDRDGDYRVIPSPGRSENPDGWVFDPVPCVPPAESFGSRQIRPGFGQVA